VDKNTQLLRKEGFTDAEIDGMTQEAVDAEIAKIEARDNEAKKSEEKAVVMEPIELEEITISGSAENTLNIGNYSSAKRGVFIGRKLKVPADMPSDKLYTVLREETRKLQMLAEAQLAGICAEAMGPEGFNDNSWFTVTKKVFLTSLAKAKTMFGVVDRPAEKKDPQQ
jgi:hypothetical protein